MLERWRLHLDECVDGRALEALTRKGIDTTSALSVDIISSSDSAELRFAAQAGRTLLTHDSDFLAESAQMLADGEHHYGVLLAPDKQNLRWLLRAVEATLSAYSPEDLRDQVRWVVTVPEEPGD